MKDKKRGLVVKLSGALAQSALFVTKTNVNTACAFLSYQGKLPEGAEKLSKIK